MTHHISNTNPAEPDKTKPARSPRNRAYEYLLKQVQTARQAQSLLLPPISKLAQQAGVSRMTLWKALAQLKREGAVTVVPRGAILANHNFSALSGHIPTTSSLPLSSSHYTRDRIQSDILAAIQTGTYPRGTPLPSFKELCKFHAGCYATVKQATSKLTEQGILVARGKKLEVAAPSRHSSKPVLTVIARVDTMVLLSTQTPRSAQFWRTLEDHCHRLNLNMQVFSCTTALDQLASTGAVTNRPSVGTIVLTLGLIREELAGLVKGLSARTLPVAFLDETASESLDDLQGMLRPYPHMALYLMSLTAHSGYAVGKHLVTLGHTKVANFALNLNSTWCLSRTIGLKTAFAQAGYPDAVTDFVNPQLPSFAHIDRALAAYKPIDELRQHVRDFEQGIAPSGFNTRGLSSDFDIIKPVWARFMLQAMISLYQQVLNYKFITAWVSVTDVLALNALDFLNQAGIPVPQQISVVGYDDTPESFGHGMTSYNFNVPGYVAAMLDFLLAGPAPGEVGPGGVRIIEGYVMVRGSSGQAPHSSGD